MPEHAAKLARGKPGCQFWPNRGTRFFLPPRNGFDMGLKERWEREKESPWLEILGTARELFVAESSTIAATVRRQTK